MFLFLFLMSNLVAYVACDMLCHVLYMLCPPRNWGGFGAFADSNVRFFLMTILPFKFNVAFIMCMVILLYGVTSSYTVHRAMAVRLIECPAVTVSFDMNRKLFDIPSYDV